MQSGPLLATLLRHLSETPADFLAEPRAGLTGRVNVAAVVNDLLLDLGGPPLSKVEAAGFTSNDPRRQRNRLSAVLIGVWLLSHPWFRAQKVSAETARGFLGEGVANLAQHVQAVDLVNDPERREELARLCLQACGYRPEGETEAQAQDRLTQLNTAERQRVIRAAQEAEKRARAIREEMARKAAEEAADKASRE